MGDMGDFWKDVRGARKESREKRYEYLVTWLDSQGWNYKWLDADKQHCRIEGEFDFWPSTGKWKNKRGRKCVARNVQRLFIAVEEFLEAGRK